MAVSPSEALRIYTALHLLGEGRPGRFFITLGLDDTGCALAVAAVASGAAVLAIEPDGQRIRRAVYAGCCDFAVSTSDEALRILKNELRQSRPVGVALAGSAADLLPVLHGRGVVPDLLLFGAASGFPRDTPAGARSCAFWGELQSGGGTHPGSCEDLQMHLQVRFPQAHVVEISRPDIGNRLRVLDSLRKNLCEEPELLQWTEAWLQKLPQLMPRASAVAVWQKRDR